MTSLLTTKARILCSICQPAQYQLRNVRLQQITSQSELRRQYHHTTTTAIRTMAGTKSTPDKTANPISGQNNTSFKCFRNQAKNIIKATFSMTSTGSSNNDNRAEIYTTLKEEYDDIINHKIKKIALHLYRHIMRSIYKQVQHANTYDEEQFTKREERQMAAMEMNAELSLIDTLPINRQDELQSRKNYYIQYTRENFIQNSDLFYDLVRPIPYQAKLRDEENTDRYDTSSSHYNYVRYTTTKDDQYNMIKKYVHIVQQGYIHHDWLLRDMKFTSSSSTKNRHVATNVLRNKTYQKQQQNIHDIQNQLHRYVDRVLQYNYNIPSTTSSSGIPNTDSTMNNQLPVNEQHQRYSAAIPFTIGSLQPTLRSPSSTTATDTPKSEQIRHAASGVDKDDDDAWSDDE